jgi:hypothetical protein
MMQFNTKSGRYSVISHGNGWAYEITDNETGDNLWFQDDSAIQLQADTDNFENEDMLSEYFGNLCE